MNISMLRITILMVELTTENVTLLRRIQISPRVLPKSFSDWCLNETRCKHPARSLDLARFLLLAWRRWLKFSPRNERILQAVCETPNSLRRTCSHNTLRVEIFQRWRQQGHTVNKSVLHVDTVECSLGVVLWNIEGCGSAALARPHGHHHRTRTQ